MTAAGLEDSFLTAAAYIILLPLRFYRGDKEMNILNLVNALPGALAQGLIWGIMAIGVYITFRILDIADLTVDGSMCTGGAV